MAVLFAPDVDATRAVGAAVASVLEVGDVVSLVGPLGAGKTAFVQGACAGLGVTATVSSPTFVLVREYGGRVPVHHVDVYRLGTLQQVIDLGFEEMLDGDAVTFVEWGDAVESLYADSFLRVSLEPQAGTDARRLTVTARGPAWSARQARLDQAVAPWTVPS